MRIEHLRFVNVINRTKSEDAAIDKVTRAVTKSDLIRLLRDEGSLVISKENGEWPAALLEMMRKHGYDGDWESAPDAPVVLDDLVVYLDAFG